MVAIHGFTGTPDSLRPILEAGIAADLPIEAPLLAGHGTVIEDMTSVGWSDWHADVHDAVERLGARVDRVVAVGQSMGGTLALDLSLNEPDMVVGTVCINPLTQPRSFEEMSMIDELIEDGLDIIPGSGSDIADPDAVDTSYDGTPLRALRSALIDGVAPLSKRLGELTQPLLVYTSRQDHVVEPSNSQFLVEQAGGPVSHVWLEHSFHVAAIDIDREQIASGTIGFVSSLSQ